MRDELASAEGIRARFKGEVARFGTKRAYKGPPIPTVLLRNIRDVSDKVVTDHLWFTMGKILKDLNLEVGDEIVFQARVAAYLKGYKGRREDCDLPPVETDYKLSHPSKVYKVVKLVEQGKLSL